jgi:monovalent cation:H+ antiporter, CPA1 family
LVASFLGILVFASLVSRFTKTPYTLTLVILGIVLAIISGLTFLPGFVQSFLTQIQSANDSLVSGPGGGLFVALVVPPLIFEALMHVKARELKEVIRPSFTLATVGVIISTIVAGYLLWKVAGLSFYAAFLFAALISPTDVATVLEIFRRAKVPSKLAALMDTEAAFNDATGIVVFTILATSFSIGAASNAPAGSTIAHSILNFILIFGGGALVGVGVAFSAELITSRITDRTSEVILSIAAVYGSYAAATAFGFSGLVAVAVVGLYFGNYTIKKAIAPTTRESVSIFWQIAAFVGNSIAFLFIGLQTNLLNLASSVGLIITAYLAVLLARVASVYPILTVFSRFGGIKIPLKWQNVAMLGGARGALSIALAASIPLATFTGPKYNGVSQIPTMVLGVAFISISLQSGVLFRYIWKKFPEEQKAKNEELSVRLSRAVAAIGAVQDLKKEGKISDEEFADQLEIGKGELEEAISDIRYDVDTTALLKSRASELYSALVQPIESMLSRPEPKKEDKPETEKTSDSSAQSV